MLLDISKIHVGTRLRAANQEKVSQIAESIKQIGLLNPITVDENYNLIAGLHRLEAIKLLGRNEIAVNVTQLTGLHAEAAEIVENLIRNELSVYEQSVQMSRLKAIYEQLHPETKAGTAGANATNKLLGNKNNANDTVSFASDTAAKTGKTGRTIRNYSKIGSTLSGYQEDIEKAGIQDSTRELLDVSRKVEAAKKQVESEVRKNTILVTEEELKAKVEARAREEAKRILEEKQQERQQKAEERREKQKKIADQKMQQPKSERLYDLIYCDPPWKYDFSSTTNRDIENQYPTMSLEEMKRLEIPSDKNSVIFMWATAPKLVEALDLLNAWGFKYKTNMVWDKEVIGMGYWFRGQHEILLVGAKGQMNPPEQSARISSVWREKRTKHSKKPNGIYNMLIDMFPDLTRIELFARNKVLGFDNWGNENV